MKTRDKPPRIHTFPNRCRLVHETPRTEVPITAIQIFVDYGSVYEAEADVRGSAHFIEHMVFKGTKKMSKSDQIFQAFDNLGAEINAYTMKRYTCYEVKCQDPAVESCLRVLVDMLLNSTFDATEFQREERVVVEENLRNVDDDDEDLDVQKDLRLYENTPYAHPVDAMAFHPATPHRGYDRKRMQGLYRTYYQPARMVVSIVSNISGARLVAMLSKTDLVSRKDAATTGVPGTLPPPGRVAPRGDIHLIPIKGGAEVIRLVVTFRVGNLFDPDRYALNLLKYVVGGHFSSRMFMILREKHGLTYTSDAITDYNEYLGEFTLYAEMDRTKFLKNGAAGPGVYPLLLEMCAELCRTGVSDRELTHTKNYLKGTRILKQESNAIHAKHNGIQTLLSVPSGVTATSGVTAGVPATFSSYRSLFHDHYEHLTPADLRRVIDKYLRRENMMVIAMGSGLPPAKRVHAVTDHYFA